MIYKNGLIFSGGAFWPLEFQVLDGRIVKMSMDSICCDDRQVDLNGAMITPGLVDIHTHGCMGFDFGSANSWEMGQMAGHYLKNGSMYLLPTLVALEKSKYLGQIGDILKNMGDNSPYMGINLEGPFLSLDKKGAQNGENILPFDESFINSLWKESGEKISLMTFSPCDENLGLLAFARGKFPLFIGHTSCDYAVASGAFQSGARGVTHLFNGFSPLHHREPGAVGAALEYPVFKELICDGIHLHDSVIRMAFKGFSREIILVSDSISACGLDGGRYDLGGLPVIVKGCQSPFFTDLFTATLEDGTLAGSCVFLSKCVTHCIKIGISAQNVFTAAITNPARLLGIEDRISLSEGNMANFIVWNKDLSFEVFKNGAKI